MGKQRFPKLALTSLLTIPSSLQITKDPETITDVHGQQSQPGLHTTNQEFVWPCNKLLQELAKLRVCLPSASSPRALLLPFQLNPDSLLLRAMSHSPLNTVSLFHQSSWRVELHENLQGGKSEGNSQWFIEELFS